MAELERFKSFTHRVRDLVQFDITENTHGWINDTPSFKRHRSRVNHDNKTY